MLVIMATIHMVQRCYRNESEEELLPYDNKQYGAKLKALHSHPAHPHHWSNDLQQTQNVGCGFPIPHYTESQGNGYPLGAKKRLKIKLQVHLTLSSLIFKEGLDSWDRLAVTS